MAIGCQLIGCWPEGFGEGEFYFPRAAGGRGRREGHNSKNLPRLAKCCTLRLGFSKEDAMTLLPRRPLFRRLLVALMIVSLLLLGVSCWLIGSKNSLDRRINAIRAEGFPATIADLAPAIIPAEDDAAAQLAAVEDRFAEFDRELARFDKTPTGKAYDEGRQRGEAPTAEQLDAMRVIVAKFPELDAVVKQAAARDGYASRYDYRLPQPQFLAAMLPRASNLRTVARFVAWQMRLAIAEGRPELAVEQGISLLRLAALYDNAEPGVVSSQIAMAVRGVAASELYNALSSGPISPELRTKLDNELGRFDPEQSLHHSLITERAITISATQDQIGGGMNAIVANTVGLPMKKMYMDAVDYYEPMLAVAEQPWPVVFQGSTSIFQTPTSYGTMADLLAPSFEAHIHAVHRTSAVLRSLRVLNAFQRYAEEHGAEAAGLADLKLPSETTVDPFTGKPLIAKSVDGTWSVYSVGKDGVDDGGELATPKDFGIGPSKPSSVSPEVRD